MYIRRTRGLYVSCVTKFLQTPIFQRFTKVDAEKSKKHTCH